MTIPHETAYKLLTYLVVIGCFDLKERQRPGRPVDRRKDFRIDVFALLVVVVAGEVGHHLILYGLDAISLGALFAPLAALRELPVAARIILGLFLGDLALYWVHRWMHYSDLLWRTHVFHHSITELYWLSGARTSLMHLVLFALPEIAIAYYLLDLTPVQAGIGFSIGAFINIWVHTNLWVNLGPLEWLFIIPNYHRVHHSASPLMHTNLGFILTIWDRIFGTYTDPRVVETEFPLGLMGNDRGLLRMIVGL
jgi:sterol desaturase/sphingolipid hydroxylase (fatty acid hydroxylase superfamily)